MGRPLGQHFLFQHSILERIADAACPPQTPLCIEIGPGLGSLTDHLIPRTERLVAVELDPLLASSLRARHYENPNVSILEADVLSTDLAQFGPAVICGNIPYYITSPIIERALAANPVRAVFLIQKEVADRLAAAPGSRDYGFLSVATQALCKVERLFTVKPSSFRPPPKVDSAVVRLTPHPAPLVPNYRAFTKFAAACFASKRKTLRNNLHRDEIPHAQKRAEQLTIGELLEVFDAIQSTASCKST